MKKTLPTLFLLLSFMAQLSVHAQFTPGISSNQGFDMTDMSSEFFRRKEKRYDKARNERLREQNIRLQRQIYLLEEELDDCMDDRARRRYPNRRKQSRYDLRQDYWGERKIEREYQELKEENEFLRDQYDWLENELDECQDRYRRDRDRRYRDRDGYRSPRTPRHRNHGHYDYDCDCYKPKPQPKCKKKDRWRDDD